MKNISNSSKTACASALSVCLLTAFLVFSFTAKSAAQGCPLVCNDLITVAVPANGTYELLPAELAGAPLAQICPAGIFQAQAQSGPQWLPASGNMIFDNSHIGQMYLCRITDQVSGNSCWGNVNVVAAPLADTIHFQLCTEFWKDGRPLRGATLKFQPINQSFPYSPQFIDLGADQSCADMTIVPSDYLPGTTFSYSASLPDTGHINGVTILDLCATRQHILGINPFSSPYAMIAADVNKSGAITTLDLVESNKLILGIYQALPNNVSWQMLPDYCQFPNPNNPFGAPCQDDISLSDLMALDGGTAKVFGIKTGDVDGDAFINGSPTPSPIPVDSVQILIPQGTVHVGDILTIPIKMDKNFTYGGLQASFQINPTFAKLDSVTSGAVSIGFLNTHYNAQSGNLRVALLHDLSTGGNLVPAGDVHFYLHLKILQNSQLEDILKLITNDLSMKAFGLGVNCGGYYAVQSKYSGSVPTFYPEFQGIRILTPSPNPFSERTVLGLELDNPETAVLEVVDLTGRLLFSEQKNLPAGFSQWEIPGAVMAYGSFSIWRLRVGNQAITGKLNRN